jgi:hypothetical protein
LPPSSGGASNGGGAISRRHSPTNASIYCAILKEKSGAPKEKIKGVSKTAADRWLRQATFWPFTMPASGIRLLMARLVAGDSTIGNTKPPTWQAETVS